MIKIIDNTKKPDPKILTLDDLPANKPLMGNIEGQSYKGPWVKVLMWVEHKDKTHIMSTGRNVDTNFGVINISQPNYILSECYFKTTPVKDIQYVNLEIHVTNQ